MSAETVAETLYATLNRPPGRIFARLRIDNVAFAYAASGIAATTIVAAGSLIPMAWQAAQPGPWEAPGFRSFLVTGFLVWLVITVIELFVAAPFVAAATWLGSRHRIESALYYVGLGGLSASGLALLPFGAPWLSSLALAVWLIAGPCGACFGLAWWYLHRRWRWESRAVDHARLAAVFLDGRAS